MDTTHLADRPADAVNVASSRKAEGAEIIVAIPSLNEADHIEACVRSLMNGDARLKAAEFIVADASSQDGTQAIVHALSQEFPNLRLINNPKKLQSGGVNLAAQAAGPGRRILVRCDAHSVYPENYIMNVADALAARGVASIVTSMDARGETCFQKANAWIVDTPLGSGGSAHRGGRKSMFVDHGHHAGFDLAMFLKVGGYDETFSHNEDAEFDTRLRQAGGQIFLDSNIRLFYLPRSTISSLAEQYFNYGKGRARTLMKHGERPRVRQLIPPATLVACLAGLAFAPLTPLTLLAPGGYLAALALASLGVAVKYKSVCGLAAGPASATMHMAWSVGFVRQLLKGQRP